jgi:RNA polymerase sigma-70 factor (ECF subfamily)
MKSLEEKDLLNQLIEKARTNGDLRALGIIYEFYYPKILKYMYYRTNCSDYEDLTAEVFHKVVKSIDRQDGNFEAWLYKIARNVVTDHWRSKNTRESANYEDSNIEDLPSRVDQIGLINTGIDIENALGQLADEQREILILRFLQGFDSLEIAKITGKSHGAVRAMQFRGLSALRKILAEGGGKK